MTAKSAEGNRPGHVRIIGGAWRGRRLRIPRGAGEDLRPTPDRVRETLFNWLAPEIEGAVCLDLFAGTGGLGFEALSRGAAEAWLVERDRLLVEALVEHAAALEGAGAAAGPRPARERGAEARAAGANAAGMPSARAQVERADAVDFLRRAAGPRFEIAFVDPPFAAPIEPVLAALVPRLRDRALVYVERPADAGLPQVDAGRWVKTGRAGAVVFGLLRF